VRLGRVNAQKSELGNITRVAINGVDRIRLIPVCDIVRLASEGSYTILHTRRKEEVLATRSLISFERQLAGSGFLRTHQKHLVNLDYVREMRKIGSGIVVLEDGVRIPVATRRKPAVMSRLLA
jgi:two-component system LytT family response regulator